MNPQAVCWPLWTGVVVAMPGSLHLSRLQAAALLALGLPPVLLLGLHSKYEHLQGLGGATLRNIAAANPLDNFSIPEKKDMSTCRACIKIYVLSCTTECWLFDVKYFGIYSTDLFSKYIFGITYIWRYLVVSFFSVSFFSHRHPAVYKPNISYICAWGFPPLYLPCPCPWSGLFRLCGLHAPHPKNASPNSWHLKIGLGPTKNTQNGCQTHFDVSFNLVSPLCSSPAQLRLHLADFCAQASPPSVSQDGTLHSI